MRPLVISLLVCAGFAGAQTEVRHAIVLPSYKDLEVPAASPS